MLVLASVPPNMMRNEVSPTVETVTVPPAGQLVMPSIAALIPAAVKLVHRKIGAELTPATRSANCCPPVVKWVNTQCCTSLIKASAAEV